MGSDAAGAAISRRRIMLGRSSGDKELEERQ
jgi:hypothetical protein